jgi:hypothetical protein
MCPGGTTGLHAGCCFSEITMVKRSTLRLTFSKCLIFRSEKYLFCLVAMFFNRQSSNLCVLTVHLFSSTCSFIRTRQISYRGLFNKCGNKLDPSLNYTFRDIDDVLPLNNIYDRVTRRMPLVEQKELTLPEHMSSSSIVVGLK